MWFVSLSRVEEASGKESQCLRQAAVALPGAGQPEAGISANLLWPGPRVQLLSALLETLTQRGLQTEARPRGRHPAMSPSVGTLSVCKEGQGARGSQVTRCLAEYMEIQPAL